MPMIITLIRFFSAQLCLFVTESFYKQMYFSIMRMDVEFGFQVILKKLVYSSQTMTKRFDTLKQDTNQCEHLHSFINVFFFASEIIGNQSQ